MNYKHTYLIGVATAAVALLSFLFLDAHLRAQTPPGTAERTVIPIIYNNRSGEAYAHADSVMQQMSDREMLAQLIMPMIYPSSQPKKLATVERLYVSNGFGGILFQKGTPADQLRMTNMLRAKSKIPVLIAADGEWGLSMRLSGTPRYPRNIVVGATNDTVLARQYGQAVAKELRRLGMHVNFAPVVDANNNAHNPVIGTRSFGSDPERVAAMGVAYALGLEQSGILSCAKHFPGHGNTTVDSHKGLPVLKQSREELEKIELLPFRRYVDNGLGGVMVGHLCVPALGTGSAPATLSKNVVTDLLQKEMGFRGLIFTDALNMDGARVDKGTSLAVQAFLAGNDILLAPASPERTLKDLVSALKNGVIECKEVVARCRKVLAMKYALGVYDNKPLPATNLSSDLNPTEHIKLIDELNQAAITLVQNSTRLVPLRSGSDIAMVSIGGNGVSTLSTALGGKLKVQSVTAAQIANPTIRTQIGKKSAVVAVVTAKSSATNELVALCKQANVVLVFACDPYTLLNFKSAIPYAKSVVLAYDSSPSAQRAIAHALMGEVVMTGRLPVDLPGLFKVGTGISPAPDPYTNSYVPLPKTTPEEVGMQATISDNIDRIAQEGINKGAYPGCQVVVAKDGFIIYSKAFGWKDAEHKEKNDPLSLYDLASVTKAAATVPLLMMAVDEKKLFVNDPIGKYLPFLAGTPKARKKVSDLLHHTAGMPAVINFYTNLIDTRTYAPPLISFRSGRDFPVKIGANAYARSGWQYDERLVSKDSGAYYPVRFAPNFFLSPGVRDMMRDEMRKAPLLSRGFRYSDIDFLLLQEILERVEGEPLDRLFEEKLAKPLGLRHTLFKPYTRFDKSDIAEGQRDRFLRKTTLRGDVDDEAAAMLGGVSGNAGLYSNAEELAVILQMFLNKGSYGDHAFINKETVELFTTAHHPTSPYAMGFDRARGRSESNYVSPYASQRVYGHTGFTGTCFWVDPDHQIVYVFLCNRGAPTRWNGKLFTLKTRRRIHDAIYSSLK